MSNEMRNLMNLFESDLTPDDISRLKHETGIEKIDGWFAQEEYIDADNKYVKAALGNTSLVPPDPESQYYYVLFLDNNVINGIKGYHIPIDVDEMTNHDIIILWKAGIRDVFDSYYEIIVSLVQIINDREIEI